MYFKKKNVFLGWVKVVRKFKFMREKELSGLFILLFMV